MTDGSNRLTSRWPEIYFWPDMGEERWLLESTFLEPPYTGRFASFWMDGTGGWRGVGTIDYSCLITMQPVRYRGSVPYYSYRPLSPVLMKYGRQFFAFPDPYVLFNTHTIGIPAGNDIWANYDVAGHLRLLEWLRINRPLTYESNVGQRPLHALYLWRKWMTKFKQFAYAVAGDFLSGVIWYLLDVLCYGQQSIAHAWYLAGQARYLDPATREEKQVTHYFSDLSDWQMPGIISPPAAQHFKMPVNLTDPEKINAVGFIRTMSLLHPILHSLNEYKK